MEVAKLIPNEEETETMNELVIIFRGRNTEGILKDARGVLRNNKIIGMDAEEQVVAREGDQLSKPGDFTVATMAARLRRFPPVKVVLVANGGTTAQLVPLMHFLTQGWNGWRGPVQIVEVTPERELIVHVDRPTLNTMDCPIGECSREQVSDYYHNTPW